MSYAPGHREAKPTATQDEATGTVLSDSLAAESLSAGGDFSSGHATASKQSAKGTTTNNYDTSAATTLDAAPDAEARMATDEWNENAQMNAGRGLAGEDGGEEKGVYKASTGLDSSRYSTSNSGSGSGSGSGSRPTEQAPTSMGENTDESTQKPGGRGITEGGFDSSAPNASFNQDIGGKNDPGRLAEQKFAEDNARSAGAAGFEGGREKSTDREGQYDTLGDEEA